jgi:hypothetical protein
MTHPRADLLRDLAHILDSIAAQPTDENAGVATAIISHELDLLQLATEQEHNR